MVKDSKTKDDKKKDSKKDDKKKDDKKSDHKKDDKKTDHKKDDKKTDHKRDHKKHDEPKPDPQTSPSNITNQVPLNSPCASILCESCRTNVPQVQYCIQCDRLLCIPCDTKGHTLPIDTAHFRIPITDSSTFGNVRQYCQFHHNNFLKYYCRTCSTALCEECRVSGHHNSQPHESIPLYDAYQTSLRMLQNSTSPAMLYRREQLLQQTRLIQRRMEEIHSIKRSIESETQADCDAIISRLSADEALKISILQNDVNILMKEINLIDRYMKYLPSETPLASINFNINANESKNIKPRQIIEFLSKYNDIFDFAENTIKKPFKTVIDIDPNFLHELNIRTTQLNKVNILEKELQVKDQIIFRLMKERNDTTINKINYEVEKVANKSKREIEEWSQLAGRLTDQLEKFKMKCSNCNIILNPDNINSECANVTHNWVHFNDL